MDEQLRRKVLAYLEEHTTLTLATTDGKHPWAAALYYVNDGFNLYFLSKPGARHCRNLAAVPVVAATITGDYSSWRQIKGVQLEGRACRVEDKKERARVMALYLKKYPFVRDFLSSPALAKALASVSVYKIMPAALWFTDNSGGYFDRQQIF